MFCSVLISGSAKSRMKRESGESPGQSRCCKLQTFTFVYPLQGHCLLNEDGKARQDLQNKVMLAFSRKGWQERA